MESKRSMNQTFECQCYLPCLIIIIIILLIPSCCDSRFLRLASGKDCLMNEWEIKNLGNALPVPIYNVSTFTRNGQEVQTFISTVRCYLESDEINSPLERCSEVCDGSLVNECLINCRVMYDCLFSAEKDGYRDLCRGTLYEIFPDEFSRPPSVVEYQSALKTADAVYPKPSLKPSYVQQQVTQEVHLPSVLWISVSVVIIVSCAITAVVTWYWTKSRYRKRPVENRDTTGDVEMTTFGGKSVENRQTNYNSLQYLYLNPTLDNEPVRSDNEPGRRDIDPGRSDNEPGRSNNEPGRSDNEPGRRDNGTGARIHSSIMPNDDRADVSARSEGHGMPPHEVSHAATKLDNGEDTESLLPAVLPDRRSV